MFSVLALYADSTIAATQLVISASVIPTIWAGRKFQGVPLTSSLLLSPGLYLIAVCLASKDLPQAAATTLFGATLWGIVATQRLLQRGR